MSVIRQANILGQQRFDVPHIRGIDSSVAADFDILAGKMIAGGQPIVVSGWTPVPFSPGSPASNLQLQVAGALLLHPEASENGTIFAVPTNRAPETLNASNARVRGSFSASTTNYVGIDLLRTPDATTADLVQFIDPDTKLETPKEVPLGRTLDYVIYVSVQDFGSTPGVCPLLKVVTDSFNNIVSVEDARNSAFRLGSGGAIPDPTYTYPWPGGRGEVGDNSDFSAGDKSITSFKDWFDAVMTRLWEVGGGEHWYSPTADRNVHMVRSGATFTNGDWFEWDGSNLHWKGLAFVFDNSTGYYNVVKNQTSDLPGLTDLADGECLYVDIDRTTNRTGGASLQPVKAQLSTLSTPIVPGSRYVIAWRYGSGSLAIVTRDAQFPVNASFTVATAVSTGVVQLTYAAGDPGTPKVAPQDGNGTIKNLGLASAAAGFEGTGGFNGVGVYGIGGLGGSPFSGSAPGVKGLGANSGPGVRGDGSVAGSIGVTGQGTTTFAGVSGIGGSSGGPGVTGTGTGTGAGMEATPGSSGAGIIVSQSSTSNKKPLVSLKDESGTYRGGFDHLGFRSPKLAEFQECWDYWDFSGCTTSGTLQVAPATNAYNYIFDVATAGAVSTTTDYSTTQNLSALSLLAPASAGRAGFARSQPSFANNAGLTAVHEVLVKVDGLSGASFFVGFAKVNAGNDIDMASTSDGIYFRKLSTDTYLTAVTRASSTSTATVLGTTNIDTSNYTLLRMEIGTWGVRFYVDGVLLATHTTNIPTTSMFWSSNVYYVATQRRLNIGPYFIGHTIQTAPVEI